MILHFFDPLPHRCLKRHSNTVQYSTVQYSTVQYISVHPGVNINSMKQVVMISDQITGCVLLHITQYSTVQYITVQYSTLQYSTGPYCKRWSQGEIPDILNSEQDTFIQFGELTQYKPPGYNHTVIQSLFRGLSNSADPIITLYKPED